MMAATHSGAALFTTPSDTQIQITREFAAPKELVYRVWTTEEYIRRWWAGKRGRVTVADIDLRVGGRWRYVLDAGGFEVGFHGEYREVVPNERIVATEVYEAMPDGEPVVTTVTFSEANGRTTLTLLADCPSKAVRDLMMQSGMEGGVQEQMDMIEQLASALA